MKLTILNSHPIQYFTPLYKELAKEKELDLTVYYCSDHSIKGIVDKEFGTKVKWDIPLLEGYQSRFFKNFSLHKNPFKFMGMVNPGIFNALRKDKPDAILIHGWAYFSYVLAIFSAFVLGIPVWLRLETPLNQEQLKTSRFSRFKQFVLKHIIFPRIDKFLFIGQQNKAFYLHMGVTEEKLFFTPYCVDNLRFQAEYNELRNQRTEIRQQLVDHDQTFIVLTSGKLIEKKRPMDLLKAFHLLDKSDCHLIFLGDGELRKDIAQYCVENGLTNVTITGFKNQSELAKYYVAADLFVLPSGMDETWGLVSNEAMNFHLPLIASDLPGSAHDLIDEGKNGFVYPTGDEKALTGYLELMHNKKNELNKWGYRSSEIVANYSYKQVIKGICQAAGIKIDSYDS
ncbi:glycosyltransferase family 4 protein [Labilibacter sediminis]|nr:glycosyltransferase family 4 protein [Labilibacter sediminis]